MAVQPEVESLDVPDLTLPHLLDQTVNEFGDRPATLYFGARLTYRQLQQAVRRFAAGLAALGVKPGDRVAVMLPNCPQTIIAFYGTLQLGAVAVMVNPLYTPREVSHQLRDAGARTLVTLDLLYNRTAREALEGYPVDHLIAASINTYMPTPLRILFPLKARKQGLDLSLPAREGIHRFQQVLGRRGEAPPAPDDPEALAILQYTGGTTGQAKGAMLTHRNLVTNIHQVLAIIPDVQPGQERIMAVLPLFHVYGLTTIMNLSVAIGAAVILLPRFVPQDTLKAITKTRPTFFPGAPPLYSALLRQKDLDRYDLSSIRYCISGAAALPEAVQNEFEARTGGLLVEGYGLTEASPVTHANPLDRERRRNGTVGLPVPGTAHKLVDLDDPDREVPQGERGELAIQGPQVMQGYWQRPEETADVLRDGWLYTGDIATLDADGYVRIVDRKKDLIIVGGFNVYPREVEEVLYAHAGVAEAAVVGIEHPTRGELVTAYVVPREGVELSSGELRSHCMTNLASYKVPRRYEIRDELPMSLAGKVLRRVLREQEEAAAEAEAAAEVDEEAPGGDGEENGVQA